MNNEQCNLEVTLCNKKMLMNDYSFCIVHCANSVEGQSPLPRSFRPAPQLDMRHAVSQYAIKFRDTTLESLGTFKEWLCR